MDNCLNLIGEFRQLVIIMATLRNFMMQLKIYVLSGESKIKICNIK
jgi:hypothetical protein